MNELKGELFMKKFEKRWLLLTLSLFVQTCLLAQQNYYQVLGIATDSSGQNIRAACVAKTFEANNTLEPQRRQKQAALEAAKATKGSDTSALEREIADLHQRITFIRSACEILQDPNQKANYDVTLGGIIAEEAAKREAAKPTVPGKEYEPGIFGDIKRMVDIQKKDADVKVFSVLGNVLSKIPIPDVGGRIFNQDLAMRNLQILPGPTGPNIRKGLGFTGTLMFNTFQVKGTIFAVELKDSSVAQFSFGIELPENYKISNIFPPFRLLDSLSLPQGKLILSSFNYTDPDGYRIEEGLNFRSRLELSGPLKALNDLKNKAKELNSVIVRLEPISFGGVIPRDVTQTALSAVIPLRLGIDFTKIPKMPKSVSDIFKEITTDDFVFQVRLPANFSFEAGVRLVLGTQTDPLRLGMLGIIDPQVISLGIRLRNMLELKFIALGNAGIQIDMDQALMPVALAFGVPFTGIGLNGEIDLGMAGPNRVNMKFAGGVRVSGTSIPDLVLQAEASNIHFANIINLASKVIAKTGIARELPADKLPVMNIDKVKGYLVLEDTEIARQKYDAGFGFALQAQLFDHKFGFSFDIKHKKLKCSGLGYMSKVDLSLKGKRIMTLSGPGLAGITSDGPVVACDFDFSSAAKMLEGKFILKSLLEIPPIDLKVKADLEIQGKAFKADLEATYVGFTTVFGINVDPAKWQEMYLKFGFKGDFEKFLSEQVKPLLLDLKKDAGVKLAAVDQKIGDLSRTVSQLQSSGTSDTQREIDKTRARIRTLESQIRALRKQCDDASLLAKAYICPKVGAELVAPGAELGAQKTYLEGLLKPGKQVIQSVTGSIADATKAIGDAQIFKKSVTGMINGLTKAIDAIGAGSSIVKVTEAIGEVSAKELGDGKLPKLISFVASVNVPDLPSVRVELKNIQFDFKNPKGSTLEIAKKLVTSIKVG